MNLPFPVLDYIHNLTIKNRSPAYLLVRKDGQLISWGGKLSAYGINDLQKGEPIGKRVFFADSLLPLDDVPLFLPCVKAESGPSVDIHIFRGDEGYWILLLDATSEETRRSILQQKTSELSFLRRKLSRIYDQYTGMDVDEKLAQELLPLREEGERRDVTILFADIRGFTSHSEKEAPEPVLKTLAQYLYTMMQTIISEGGMVDNIIGDEVMGIFGLVATIGSPPTHAIWAALKMLEDVEALNKERKRQNRTKFDIGVGIASGHVALGILDSKERKILSAVGQPVKLAACLERGARPNEILIDENTFKSIHNFQTNFSAVTLRLKGTDSPLRAFSCEGDMNLNIIQGEMI